MNCSKFLNIICLLWGCCLYSPTGFEPVYYSQNQAFPFGGDTDPNQSQEFKACYKGNILAFSLISDASVKKINMNQHGALQYAQNDPITLSSNNNIICSALFSSSRTFDVGSLCVLMTETLMVFNDQLYQLQKEVTIKVEELSNIRITNDQHVINNDDKFKIIGSESNNVISAPSDFKTFSPSLKDRVYSKKMLAAVPSSAVLALAFALPFWIGWFQGSESEKKEIFRLFAGGSLIPLGVIMGIFAFEILLFQPFVPKKRISNQIDQNDQNHQIVTITEDLLPERKVPFWLMLSCGISCCVGLAVLVVFFAGWGTHSGYVQNYPYGFFNGLLILGITNLNAMMWRMKWSNVYYERFGYCVNQKALCFV